jgi:hypothetical protein
VQCELNIILAPNYWLSLSFSRPAIYSGFICTKIQSGRLPRAHSHYKDFLDLRGDGRVVLYKRADRQNPGSPAFVVKSAKTTNDHEAKRFS